MAIDFVRIPPDSTGKKIVHNESSAGYVQVFHLADANNVARLQQVNEYGAALISFNEGQPTLDAFGNLRVTEESVIGAYDHVVEPQDDLYSQFLAAGGTQTWDPASSSIILAVTGDASSMSTRVTNRYHYYMPGTGMLVLMTLALGDSGKEGNERGWGLMDAENGMAFSLVGEDLCVEIVSNATGTREVRRVFQKDWNGDKLDGTGVSKYVLDITKRNLYWISFGWLGVASVRFGVFGDKGQRILAHTFINANGPAYPFMRTATLPLMVCNRNHAATGSSSELKYICAAIYSDNKQSNVFWRHGDIGMTGIKDVSVNTPLIGIRSKTFLFDTSLYNRVHAYPEILSVYVSGGPIKLMYFDNVLDSHVIGATWNIDSVGTIEADDTATSVNVAGVAPMLTWYLDPGCHNIDMSKHYEINDEGIHMRADNTRNSFTFIASALVTPDASVKLNLTFKELY